MRDQWRRTQSGSIAAVEPEPNSGQRDLTEAECPICYDDFSEQEDVVWCKARFRIALPVQHFMPALRDACCLHRGLRHLPILSVFMPDAAAEHLNLCRAGMRKQYTSELLCKLGQGQDSCSC